MPSRSYTCHLLEDGVYLFPPIELSCDEAAEAILAGRAIAEARGRHQSYEVRFGDRLIYRHEGPHLRAKQAV